MLDRLLTEQRNPASANIDTLSTDEVLRVINDQDAGVAEAVRRELPSIARAVDAIVKALGGGGRLFYTGAGTSGRLGVLDASECPPTFSVPAGMVIGIIAGGDSALRRSAEAVEDDPEAGARDLAAHGFSAGDVLVGIAASGRTPYVLGAMQLAAGLGAVTVGLSCTTDSELALAATIAITPLTGPEVVTGSTRLKAGTATKLVLNMLTTASFIRLGYVYGNLMVNVRPSNVKLLERARRIVREAAGVDAERAAQLLESAGMSVRTAILMGKTGAGRAQAESLLAKAGGRLGEAIALAGAGRGPDLNPEI